MRFAATLVFVLATLASRGEAIDTLLGLFEARYSSARTLQASFLERYRENGGLVRAEAGEVYFFRPGKMRWDYQAPEKNTFLVDGKYVWFYSPADHTATRTPVKRSEDWRTPLAFLTTHMRLSQLCSKMEPARDEKPSKPDGTVYRCTLHGTRDSTSPAANSVLFELSPEGHLDRIVVPQEGGIELEFSFAAWHWDPKLDASLFQFVPSRDTVMVEGTLPDTPGLRQ